MRVAILLLALGIPGVLSGQQVRGRVVGAGDAVPLPSAVVELRQVGTAFTARTTTSSSGTFLVAGPRTGRYTLRIAAIGYAPRITEPFDLPVDGIRLGDVALERAVITLQELEVLETASRCGALGAGSGVLGRLLDGARTSLEVMEQSLAGRGSGFRIEMVRRTAIAMRRDSMITADTIHGELVRWPISALDPERLREHGFVDAGSFDLPEGRTWYGPDLGVLSAEWFLASHCFRVEPKRGDSTSIVLAYEPESRSNRVDIAGTLVLDRETLALTAMTFEHRNLPDRLPHGVAGGEIRFAPLPSGLWLPIAWRIYAPVQGQMNRRAMGIEERAGRVLGVEPVTESPVRRRGALDE